MTVTLYCLGSMMLSRSEGLEASRQIFQYGFLLQFPNLKRERRVKDQLGVQFKFRLYALRFKGFLPKLALRNNAILNLVQSKLESSMRRPLDLLVPCLSVIVQQMRCSQFSERHTVIPLLVCSTEIPHRDKRLQSSHVNVAS